MNGRIIIASLMLASLAGVLGRISLFGVSLSLLDLAVAVIVIIGGLGSYRAGRLELALNQPAVRYLLFFVGAIGLSWLIALPAIFGSATALGMSLLYALRLIGYLIAGIIVYAETDKQDFIVYQNMILWCGALFAILGLVELAIFPDFRIYDHLGWDPHQHRLLSSFLDPNFAAVWLAGVLGLAVTSYFYAPKLRTKIRTGLIGFVLLIGTFLTLSRSGLLALAGVLGLTALNFFKPWFWVVVVGGLASILITPSLNQRLIGAINLDTTVRLRLNSWESAATLVRHHPIFGIGYNTLKFRRYDSALPGTSRLISRMEDGVVRVDGLTSRADAGFDSSLLTILATTGLIGLGTFLWWVWNAIMSAVRFIRHQKAALHSSWFLAFTASLFLASWFVNAWLYPPILILWLIAWALSTREQQN